MYLGGIICVVFIQFYEISHLTFWLTVKIVIFRKPVESKSSNTHIFLLRQQQIEHKHSI